MRRRPHLPPGGRGPAALRLTAAAAEGILRLPVCAACGHVQYPPAEFCSACLGDDLDWRRIDGRGRIVATTLLHRSTGKYFEARLPWPIGTVKLAAGPVVVAHLGPGAKAVGDRVRLLNRLDAAGQAALVAVAEGMNGDEIREAGMPGQDTNTEIAGKTVLVTGASGGIGGALLAAFAEAGAGRVLAAARDPAGLAGDGVEALPLDVTEPGSIAALPLADVDILVNNAGCNHNEGLIAAADISLAEEEMAVNYLGTLRLIRAAAPAMKARSAGVIVNLATILSHVNLPLMGSYCASKAALLSLTQGVRAELAPWGVRVIGIYPGAVDTRMSADFPPPKMAPAAVARAVVEAIRDGIEDCYPGDMAAELHRKLLQDPKAVERELAGFLPEPH